MSLLFRRHRRPGFAGYIDDHTTTVIAAMLSAGGRVNYDREILINDLIVRLKSLGIWHKLDCLYLFAALDSASALINWKNPGTFNATLSNAPAFAADRGFTGNGSNASINSGFTPSAAGGRYTQDSATFGGRSLTSAAASGGNRMGGTASGGGTVQCNPRNTGDVISSTINDATTFTASNATTLGFYLASRTGSGARSFYKDGAALNADTQASTTLPIVGLAFLQTNGTFSSLQMASGVIGGGLTDANVAAFYAAELTYMQAVGAA